jgi:hypothetical protein
MTSRASINLSLLGAVAGCLALLISILCSIYVATYLENGKDQAKANKSIAEALNRQTDFFERNFISARPQKRD